MRKRTNLYFHPGGELNEIKQTVFQFLDFRNRSSLGSGIHYSSFDMLYPNDILKNDNPLPAGKYQNLSLDIRYVTDQRKRIVLSLLGEYGKFYNGRKLSTDIQVIMKAQPWGVFTLSHKLCELTFKEFSEYELYHLAGFRSEIYFTRDLSWTTLIQYNTQIDNININSLFRWRFRPQSDIFFVIKDDMNTNGDQKQYQFVFKYNYWFRV